MCTKELGDLYETSQNTKNTKVDTVASINYYGNIDATAHHAYVEWTNDEGLEIDDIDNLTSIMDI